MLLILATLTTGCQKYLDAKPNKSFVIPSSVDDLQALLDENQRMNTRAPSLGVISADDYYADTTTLEILPLTNIAAYTWDTGIYLKGTVANDWSQTYDPVYYANTALETITTIDKTTANAAAWDNVKGSALFYRAYSFLEAAWLWSLAYDDNSADPGIPLRLSSDFNTPSVRATMLDTYKQITGDLLTAIPLLPVKALYPTRPSKAAAYGLLARTYLSMRDYGKAGKYADSCLQLDNTLIDYNSLNSAVAFPFSRFNPETIFYSIMSVNYAINTPGHMLVNKDIMNTYEKGDLRKNLFYTTANDIDYSFRGSYDGTSYFFAGIATDEIYLVSAECNARLGNTQKALDMLNHLLETRWQKSRYNDIDIQTPDSLLAIILKERRKELVFRGLRWADIKRLNKEGNQIDIVHPTADITYTLPANDNRYALPIPADVIQLSGMQQNKR